MPGLRRFVAPNLMGAAKPAKLVRADQQVGGEGATREFPAP